MNHARTTTRVTQPSPRIFLHTKADVCFIMYQRDRKGLLCYQLFVQKHMGIVSHSQGLFIFISVSPTLPTNVPVIYLHVGLGQSEDLRKDFGDVKVLQLEPLVGT